MKSLIVTFILAATLLSCDTKERERLQSSVDSLNIVLVDNNKREIAMNEVGIVLDSIDNNRQALRVKIVEGISYADYVTRLKAINEHIKNSKLRIASLESNLKNSKTTSAATIRRLKADVEQKSQEIVGLQLEVIKLREQNGSMKASLSQKDSTISSQSETIRLKSAEVSSMQVLVSDLNEQNRVKVAGLYYAQASALETAADRTKFAPRKKKATRLEALELYRLSFSLGNNDAAAKIAELEKEIG
jgi:hypothetical protein